MWAATVSLRGSHPSLAAARPDAKGKKRGKMPRPRRWSDDNSRARYLLRERLKFIRRFAIRYGIALGDVDAGIESLINDLSCPPMIYPQGEDIADIPSSNAGDAKWEENDPPQVSMEWNPVLSGRVALGLERVNRDPVGGVDVSGPFEAWGSEDFAIMDSLGRHLGRISNLYRAAEYGLKTLCVMENRGSNPLPVHLLLKLYESLSPRIMSEINDSFLTNKNGIHEKDQSDDDIVDVLAQCDDMYWMIHYGIFTSREFNYPEDFVHAVRAITMTVMFEETFMEMAPILDQYVASDDVRQASRERDQEMMAMYQEWADAAMKEIDGEPHIVFSGR